LTAVGRLANHSTVGESRGKRKHRHDGPDVDHGAISQEHTTVAIQFILGVAIVLTAALMLYAFLSAGVDAPLT
jgi:hypothetical protein